MTAEQLAREIADELLKNGIGETADRLVLEVSGKDCGGYCRAAVERIIAARLAPLVSELEEAKKLIAHHENNLKWSYGP